MKVKELQKTVNVAWSPEQLNDDIYLAAGTAAQQLDTSPNNTIATLEIYSANLLDPGYDLELKGSQSSKYRFQKIVWSPTGISNGTHSNGLLVGGCEGGHIQIYSASKLLKNYNNSYNGAPEHGTTITSSGANSHGSSAEDALLAHQDKHTGTVRGLDFNPFQHNLLASVASESEIFIWDLNNTTTPMAPGTKTQPLDDIQNVAWNRQVQHILSTVFSTKCVIWDLRKNEQIIKLTDTQSRIRWRAIQWHPDVATQLWLASEDDTAPYVQLWDLRYATAPTKTIQIHQRGVLGLTWCPKDTDLMVSCGKDNKIYCWNPNTELAEGEILSEVATTIQWYSDVQWCPRNPALIASSSFDGNVSVYSLFGGHQQQVQTSNKIADSFPGMDQFAQAPPPLQQSSHATHVQYSDLKRPPKWMKRSVGVSFGFGGRLLMFNQQNQRIINICQVITEPNLVQRSVELEKAIDDGQFIEYCRQKADKMQDQHNRLLWYFIKANFEENPRAEMLNLLGYNREDLTSKYDKYIKSDADDDDNQITATTTTSNQVDRLTKQISLLSHAGDNNALFDAAGGGGGSFGSGGDKTLEDLPQSLAAVKSKIDTAPFKIPTGESKEALICQAILTGNIEAAAEICMNSNRPAEALIIASTAPAAENGLLRKIQLRYLMMMMMKQNQNNTNGDIELSHIINALITQDWLNVTQNCTLDSWKEALVAVLTYCETQQQIQYLCDRLGERLLNQQQQNNVLSSYDTTTNNTSTQMLAKNSLFCYICSGNIDKLIESWLLINNHQKSENNNNNSDGDEYQNNSSINISKLTTDQLQDLIEIVMLCKKSLEIRGQNFQPTGKLAEFLSQYAGLLAAQGALNSALSYLGPSQDPELEDLRERLYFALGHKQQRQQTLSSSRGSGSISLAHNQQQQSTTNLLYGKQTAVSGGPPMSSTTINRYGQQQQQQQRTNSFSNQGGMVPPISGGGLIAQNTFNTMPLPGVTTQPWNTNPVNQQQQQQQQSPPLQPWNTTSTSNYDSQQQLLQNTMPPPPPPTGPPPTSVSKSSSITSDSGLNRPQRPSSVGSQGRATPLSRAKYVLDPSVTSGPNYGQTMGVYNPQPPPINNQPTSFNANNTNFGQFNNHNPSFAVPPLPPVSSPSTTGLNSMQNNTTNNYQQFTPAPLIPTNPSGYLSGIAPIEMAQQALPPPPPTATGGGIQKNPTPPPGWNDPPAIKTRQQPKSEPPTQLNPITHPIFGVDPNQGQNGFPDHNLTTATGISTGGGSSNSQFQNRGMPPPPPSAPQQHHNTPITSAQLTSQQQQQQQQQNMPPPPASSSSSSFNLQFQQSSSIPSMDTNKIYNPMSYQTQAVQQQQHHQPPPQSQMYQPYHEVPDPAAATFKSEPIKEKPPLPEEFIYMQTVFEELKTQCQNIAPDPRTKRKFVDVTKRLESLYDTLRGNKLSQNTLSALNQIVQFIQIGDYQNAMSVYMQIVSGADFSQTANFMPGIKVLIQSATELKVYLR